MNFKQEASVSQQTDQSAELGVHLCGSGMLQLHVRPPPCLKRSSVSICFVLDISDRLVWENSKPADGLEDKTFEQTFALSLNSLLCPLSSNDQVAFVVSNNEKKPSTLKPVSMNEDGKMQVNMFLDDFRTCNANRLLESLDTAVSLLNESIRSSAFPVLPTIVVISDQRETKKDEDKWALNEGQVRKIRNLVDSQSAIKDTLSIHAVTISKTPDSYFFLEIAKEFGGQLSHIENIENPQLYLAPIVSNILTQFTPKLNVAIQFNKEKDVAVLRQNGVSQLFPSEVSTENKNISIQVGALQYEQSKEISIRLSNAETISSDDSVFASITLSYPLAEVGETKSLLFKTQKYEILNSQLRTEESRSETNLAIQNIELARATFLELLFSNTKKFEFGIQSYAISGLQNLLSTLKVAVNDELSYVQSLILALEQMIQNTFTSQSVFKANRPTLLALIRSHALQQQTILHPSLLNFAHKRVNHYLNQIQQALSNLPSPQPSPRKRREHSPHSSESCIKVKSFDMYEIYECARF